MRIVILHEQTSEAKQFAKDNNLKFTRYNSTTALDEHGNEFRFVGISEPAGLMGLRYDQVIILKGSAIEYKINHRLDFMDDVETGLSDLVPDGFKIIIVDSKINRNYWRTV